MAFQPKAAFEDISRGDGAAYGFLSSFFLFAHKQDDLIDRDKAVPPEMSVGFDLQVLQAFARNSFFQKHQDFLWPVIVTSGLAYIASEERKNAPDVLDRLTAQVLKSEYLNVFLAAAHCIGGFDHALAMSRKYRDYHFDAEPAV